MFWQMSEACQWNEDDAIKLNGKIFDVFVVVVADDILGALGLK